jgi:DNA-binding response OmpR family regulator
MTQPCLLIVEADVLVRNPLAEYLRECGYRVLEASNTAEARQLLSEGPKPIDIVFADAEGPGENGFAFAAWVRANHPDVDVVLVGTVAKAVESALLKPLDHRLVLNHIRRLLAARDRNGRKD